MSISVVLQLIIASKVSVIDSLKHFSYVPHLFSLKESYQNKVLKARGSSLASSVQKPEHEADFESSLVRQVVASIGA